MRHLLIALFSVFYLGSSAQVGGVDLRQIIPDSTQLMVPVTDSFIANEWYQKYLKLQDPHLYLKEDSICFTLFDGRDTACVLLPEPDLASDTLYYWRFQVDGGAIDTIIQGELIHLQAGDNITITGGTDGPTIHATTSDSCIQSLLVINDSTVIITGCNTSVGKDTVIFRFPEDSLLTPDTYTTRHSFVGDTLTTYRDSLGITVDSFKVRIATDTIYQIQVYDSTTAVLSLTGDPNNELVVLPWKDADANDYSANYTDSIKHDGYVLIGDDLKPNHPLEVLGPAAPPQVNIKNNSTGSATLQMTYANSMGPDAASKTIWGGDNFTILDGGLDSLMRLDTMNRDSLGYDHLLWLRSNGQLSLGHYGTGLQYYGLPHDYILTTGGVGGAIAEMPISDLIDSTKIWADTGTFILDTLTIYIDSSNVTIDSFKVYIPLDGGDTYVDSAAVTSTGAIDSIWFFRDSMNVDVDSFLVVLNDSVANDHDWYKKLGTNQASSIWDDIYTRGRVTIGADTLGTIGGVSPITLGFHTLTVQTDNSNAAVFNNPFSSDIIVDWSSPTRNWYWRLLADQFNLGEGATGQYISNEAGYAGSTPILQLRSDETFRYGGYGIGGPTGDPVYGLLYVNNLGEVSQISPSILQDTIGQDTIPDADWYKIGTTEVPYDIGDDIYHGTDVGFRVRMGQDSLENALNVLINGGTFPLGTYSSTSTNIFRQVSRVTDDVFDHVNQAGVAYFSLGNLGTGLSGHYIDMVFGYTGENPLLNISEDDIGFYKYPTTRDDGEPFDSLMHLYYPADTAGKMHLMPIEEVKKAFNDYDFRKLQGDTIDAGSIYDWLPNDTTDIDNLVWRSGNIRIGSPDTSLSFGGTYALIDSNLTKLQIKGKTQALELYHQDSVDMYMRNAGADWVIRASNADTLFKIGSNTLVDGDTTYREMFRIQGKANANALYIAKDSMQLGDYLGPDTTITVAEIIAGGVMLNDADGWLRSVSPDTLNEFLNVAASTPNITFFDYKEDSLGLELNGSLDTSFVEIVMGMSVGDSTWVLQQDSLWSDSLGLSASDSTFILEQGDSLGTVWNDGELVISDGTRSGKVFSTLTAESDMVMNLPGDIRTGSTTGTVAFRMGKNRTSQGTVQLDFMTQASPGFGDFGTRLLRAADPATGGFTFQNAGTGNINFYTQSNTYLNATFRGTDGSLAFPQYGTLDFETGENFVGAIASMALFDGDGDVGEITLANLETAMGGPFQTGSELDQQTFAHSFVGGDTFNIVISGSLDKFQIVEGDGIILAPSGSGQHEVTITAEDISASNELQTITFSSPSSTTQRLSLSNGGSLDFIAGNAIDKVDGGTAVTFNHANTSDEPSQNNAGQNFIQDITLDTYGHITDMVFGTAGGADDLGFTTGGAGRIIYALNTLDDGETDANFVWDDGAKTLTMSSTVIDGNDRTFTWSGGGGTFFAGGDIILDDEVLIGETSSQRMKIVGGGTESQIYHEDYTDARVDFSGGGVTVRAGTTATADVDGSVQILSFGQGLVRSGGNLTLESTGGDIDLVPNGDVLINGSFHASDRRLKKRITALDNVYEKILALKPVTFEWKRNNKQSIGFIAQDFQEVLPEHVKTKNGFLSIDSGAASTYTTAAVQQLIKDNEKQKQTIDDLRRVVTSHEDRLLKLEELINKR